eukprot:SAG11_NODE_27577_length_331_cov_0.706897_1_plen_69_part_10
MCVICVRGTQRIELTLCFMWSSLYVFSAIWEHFRVRHSWSPSMASLAWCDGTEVWCDGKDHRYVVLDGK